MASGEGEVHEAGQVRGQKSAKKIEVSISRMRFMMAIFTPGEKRRVMGGRHGASSEEAAADDVESERP